MKITYMFFLEESKQNVCLFRARIIVTMGALYDAEKLDVRERMFIVEWFLVVQLLIKEDMLGQVLVSCFVE